MILSVVMGTQSGETHTREFEIPDEDFVQWMRLDIASGPVMITTFTTHTDMRALHTVCRRRTNVIDRLEH